MLVIASVLVPAALVYSTILEVDREAHGGPACGLPVLGSFLLGSAVCVLLSAIGLVLGLIAYRLLSPPRPRRRLIELVTLALPLLIIGGYAGSIILDLRR
jgi:hypothetical protein